MRLAHLLLALALAGGAVWAERPASGPARGGAAPLSSARGTVLEVDAREQRVLIDHGPIRSLGMDAMAMEFRVPERRQLARLRPGDRIRFAASYEGGDYVARDIRVVRRAPPKGAGPLTRP